MSKYTAGNITIKIKSIKKLKCEKIKNIVYANLLLQDVDLITYYNDSKPYSINDLFIKTKKQTWKNGEYIPAKIILKHNDGRTILILDKK